MSTVLVTADLHLGHERVIEIRGYPTAAEHDDAIEDAWRAAVRPDDIVWVLGDLCLSHLENTLDRIATWPGRKRLIAGNHDACHPMHRHAPKTLPRYLRTFEYVSTVATARHAGQTVLLSHFPYVGGGDHFDTERYPQWRLVDYGGLLLHGHGHTRGTRRRTGPRSLDIGLDAWHAPIPLHQALEELAHAT